MTPNLLTLLTKIEERKSIVDKMLIGLRYSGLQKERIGDDLQNRLNSEITDYNKKVLNADTRKVTNKIIHDIENKLKNNVMYIKIESGKLNYVILDKKYYRFDLRKIINTTSMQDVDAVVEELVVNIFQNSIIDVINEANKLIFIKNLHSNRIILKRIDRIVQYVHNKIIVHKYHLLTLMLLSFITLIYLLINQSISIKLQTQQTVSLALMGLVATFSGFAVVFVQLSFDNYKKYYGYYSKVLLFESIGKEIIILFSLNMLLELLCASSDEEYIYNISHIHNLKLHQLTFFLSILFFTCFLILLMYKVRYIFYFSLSYNYLSKTIKKINIDSINSYLLVSKNFENTDLILRNFEENYVEIISDIVLNYISQSNYKTSEVLIIEFTKHFQSLIIENNSVNNKDNSVDKIVIVYGDIMRKIIESINYTNYKELVSVCNNCLKVIAYDSALSECNHVALRSMLNAFKSAFKLSLNTNSADIILSWFKQCKDAIIFYTLYNSPPLNDSRAGSPYMATVRRDVFYKSSNLYNVLGDFLNELYDNIVISVGDNRNISTYERYYYISTYKELLENNILYNYNKYLRGSYIFSISHNLLSLYEKAFQKLDHKNLSFSQYQHYLQDYSPINVHLLEHCIKYDSEHVSSSMLEVYMLWNQYIMNGDNDPEFTSGTIHETIYLLYRLFEFIDKQNEDGNIDSTIVRVCQTAIDNIIDIFYKYPYEESETGRSIASAVNSNFWQFAEFEYKKFKVKNSSFSDKIEFILAKTIWANTQ